MVNCCSKLIKNIVTLPFFFVLATIALSGGLMSMMPHFRSFITISTFIPLSLICIIWSFYWPEGLCNLVLMDGWAYFLGPRTAGILAKIFFALLAAAFFGVAYRELVLLLKQKE